MFRASAGYGVPAPSPRRTPPRADWPGDREQRRDPVRYAGGAVGDRGDCARLGNRLSRRHDRERRVAGDRPGSEDRRGRIAVDGRRLPRDAHRAAVVRGRARRPLRAEADLLDGSGVVHGRERRVRGRARRHSAGVLTCRAGRRGRAPGARKPRDHRLGLSRRRPRSRDRCVVGPGRHRQRDRPVRRRLADRHVLVALGVPREHPVGGRRGSHHGAPRAGVERRFGSTARRDGRVAGCGRPGHLVLGAHREPQRVRCGRARLRARRRGRDRRLLRGGAPQLAPDVAAPAVSHPPVQRLQRHDPRRLRRARGRAVHGRVGAAALPRLLGPRSRRVARADYLVDAPALPAVRRARATHRAAAADDDRAR